MTATKPPVWVLLNDDTRPRRRMVLRNDGIGLVHWARDDMGDNAGALPYCFAQTGARLVIFFRYGHNVPLDAPTCLWCALEPCKRSRRLW